MVRGTVCKLGKEKRHGRTVRGNVGISADHRITSLVLYNFARKRGVAYLRWSAQRLLCGRAKVFTALWTRPYNRVPEIVTRGRFPDGGESDSTWRTQEARHVGSDTIAPGF